MDGVDTIERYLSDAALGKRLDAIEYLRTALREDAGSSAVLSNFSGKLVILRALERCLTDRSWEIRHKAIQFLNEILERDQFSADQYIFSLIPPLILCVADPKITVRRVALQTLHCYLRYANDRKLALYSIVKYGLDNVDIAVQRDWCVALPVVLTPEHSELDYTEVIQSLVRKLDSRELSDTALKVLRHVENLVGTQRFYDTVKRLPHAARYSLARHDANVAAMLTPSPSVASTSTSSAVRNSVLSLAAEPSARPSREDPGPEVDGEQAIIEAHFSARAPRPNNAAAPFGWSEQTSSRTARGYAQPQPQPQATQPARAAHSDSEMDEEDEEEEVKFGCLPVAIANMLENENDAKAHTAGGDELKKLVQTLSDDDIRRMEPHLLGFLSYLNSFLDDPNLRFTMLVLESLELLVAKLANYLQTAAAKRGSVQLSIETNLYVRHILAILMKRLSENKSILRQTAFKTIVHLMHIFQKPMLILDQLAALNFFTHRNSRIRQETLNLLIVALLTYPTTQFDLAKLCHLVAGLLVDAKRQVRLAAFECIAVLAQALGPNNRQSLLNAIDQIELEQVQAAGVANGDDTTLMSAVQARLARRQLPRLIRSPTSTSANEIDLQIEYALQLPSAGQLRQFPFAALSADVKWITAAATGSSSTVPSASASASAQQQQQRANGSNSNGNTIEQYRPIQAWVAPPEPSLAADKPTLAHSQRAAPQSSNNGANTADDVPQTFTGRARIGSGSLRFSAAKLRKLLPWEQESSAAAVAPASATATETSAKQPFSKHASVNDSVSHEFPTGRAPQPSSNANLPQQQQQQQQSGNNAAKQDKTASSVSVREQLQQLNASVQPTKKPAANPSTKPKPQVVLPPQAPQAEPQKAASQSNVSNKPAAATAPALGKNVKPDEPPHAPHPPAAPKTAQQAADSVAATASNRRISNGNGSPKRRAQSIDSKAVAQSVAAPALAVNASSNLQSSKAVAPVREPPQQPQPQQAQPQPPTAAAAGASSRPANKQTSGTQPMSVRQSVAELKEQSQQTPMASHRKQSTEEISNTADVQLEKTPPSMNNTSTTTSLVQKSVSTPSFAAIARGSQIPLGMPSQESPVRRASMFIPESVSFDIPVAAAATTANAKPKPQVSLREQVSRDLLASDASDDSDMEMAIQSIRSSAAKKRAERLERLRQAAKESHSAPPHSNHNTKNEAQRNRGLFQLQQQHSEPNAQDTEDDDDEPFEFEDEEEDDDGSTLEDTDDDHGDSGSSARSRMSQKLVESMNRKQLQQLQQQQQQRRPQQPQQQASEPISQSASSTLRKPPTGAAPQKNSTLNRSNFKSSNPNLAGGPALLHSKSAGAVASADDEQMYRDLQFIADKSPTELMRMAMNGINNQNSEMWEDVCRCLNIVRFLARQHTGFLQNEYRNIRLPILREVRNLRTQVNRLAIQTFGDLFEYLGKVTEIELDSTVEYILHRAGDTNKFIQQQVQNTLMRLVRFLSPSAAIPSLIQFGAAHRNPLIRRTTAQFVAVSIQRYVASQTTRTALHESAQAYGASASEDADPGCRQHGRQILAALNGSAKGSAGGQGHDPNNNSDRKQASSAPNARSKRNSVGAMQSPSQAQAQSQSKAQVTDLPTIVNELQAADWQTRLRGVEDYQSFFAQAQASTDELSVEQARAFEEYCCCLKDNNVKVSIAALQLLNSHYQTVLQHAALDNKSRSANSLSLKVCIDCLLPNLASRNEQVFALSNDILDNFIGDLLENATELINPICSYYQSTQNDLVRAYLLEKLSYIVPRTYSKRAVVIQSSLIPFVWKALNSLSHIFARDRDSGLLTSASARTGGDVEREKLAFAKLLKSLYRQMKDDLVDSLEQQKSAGQADKADRLITLLTEQQLSLKEFVGKLAT